MSKKSAKITNPLLIGKTLGEFNVDKNGPNMWMDLKAIDEKAKKISDILGVQLSGEDVALFTFLHEMAHYKQWKDGSVTTEDMKDIKFRGSDRAKNLEVEADAEAVDFIKKTIGYGKKWSKRSLKAMIGAEKELTLEQARDLGIIS
jgi:hypothetical protein